MDKYNTIGARFVALIIDMIVMIPVSLVPFFLVGLGNSIKALIIINVIIGAVPVAYNVLMHGYYGQTLGKMAMKVKVFDVSERKMTLTQAVVRSLPQMLPVFISASYSTAEMSASPENISSRNFLTIAITAAYILYFVWSIADIIVCLASDKKRSLHDLIAGTIVVKVDNRISVTP